MKNLFSHERKPNLSLRQWYIYFSSIRIQTWVIFGGYIAISQHSGFLYKSYKSLLCLTVKPIVIMNLIYEFDINDFVIYIHFIVTNFERIA